MIKKILALFLLVLLFILVINNKREYFDSKFGSGHSCNKNSECQSNKCNVLYNFNGTTIKTCG